MRWLNNDQPTDPLAHRIWPLLAILGFVSLILGLTLYQMTEAGPPLHGYTHPLEEPRNGFPGENLDDYPPEPVGGVIIPTNRFELLAPWVGLAALISLAVLGVVLMWRRRP